MAITTRATSTLRGRNARREIAPIARGTVIAYHAADETPDGIAKADVLLSRGFCVFGAHILGGGGHGNAAWWVPSPATHDTRTGREFDLEEWDTFDPSSLNGTRVIVGFINNDPVFPVILGQAPTRAIKNRTKAAGNATNIPSDGAHPATPDGTVQYIEHQGTRVMLDRFGNVVIDTTKAPVDDAGNPLTPGSQPAGRVTVNIKSSSNFELRVDGQQMVQVKQGEINITVPAGQVNVEAQSATIKTTGNATIEAGGNAVVNATGPASKVLLGTGVIAPLDGVVTQSCNCSFTGAPHPVASLKVQAAKA